MNPSIEQVEQLVRERRIALARESIRAYLKSQRSRAHVIFQACDWYRRLGLYRDAYRLIETRGLPRGEHSTATPEGMTLLWGARLLTLMGAGHHSLELASRVRATAPDMLRTLGVIFLANHRYPEALRCYEKMRAVSREPYPYSIRVGLIELADSLSGLTRHREALDALKTISASKDEGTLKAILLQAEGEYLARLGRYKSSIACLRKAQALIPPGDTTLDFAFLCKWLGFALVKAGARAEGLRLLKRAEPLLKRPDLRIETYLDLVRLRGELGLLSSADIARLYFYPALAPAFREALPPLEQHCFGNSRARIRIDLSRNEYERDGARYLGLPKEVELLAWLRIASDWGISAARAFGILWPDEPYSLIQLEKRLEQLQIRLRSSYGIALSSRDRVIRLDLISSKEICAEISSEPRLPSFLESRERFTTQELQAYYPLSKTQTLERLKEWKAKGWITESGNARARTYIAASSRD